MLFTDNSDAIVVGGLTVHSNGIGVLGDGAGVLRLQQNELYPSEIANNQAEDALMIFGTRVDIGENVSATLTCDPTALTPNGPCFTPGG